MPKRPDNNPLIGPVQELFDMNRGKRDGLVSRNRLLIVLCILDRIGESHTALSEDDIYTYNYTLKGSRAKAIPALLAKYSLPVNLGMSSEGVTVRGAPGLRMFRAIQGGAVIMDRPKPQREALVHEAIELVRAELMKVVARGPVTLPPHKFKQSGAFVAALLKAVENRSNGRVEQALVGAKLQLRFRDMVIPNNPGFAGDRQPGRDCDFEAGILRAIVSVSPKKQHFESAAMLADEGLQVYLVVAKKSLASATKQIEKLGHEDTVTVTTVKDYVASNMKEILIERGITPAEMCIELATEYNRRIAADNDPSLQVTLPD